MTAPPGPDAPIPGSEHASAPLPDVPPPPASARRPPLRRSHSDYVLGGVCGGLAEFTGVESFLWRIGFIAFGLLGGEGFLAYVLLWILVPDSDPPPEEDHGAGRTGVVQRLRTGLTPSR